MLTADLVPARRRGDRLEVQRIPDRYRSGALEVARELLAAFEQGAGHSRAEVDAFCDEVAVSAHLQKRANGFRKLLHDRSTFEPEPGPEPEELRRVLFTHAAALRRDSDAPLFDRDEALRRAAVDLGCEPDAVERRLFADRKQEHRLTAFEPLTAEALLEHYERSAAQAVLLRALRVTVTLESRQAAGTRALFRKLKFLRLLHRTLPRSAGGYRVVIDGPASMFQASSRYGLQLALLLPALEAAGPWSLEADVVWGPEKQRLRYELSGDGAAAKAAQGRLPDEVQKLKERFKALKSDWEVRTAARILELPGVGLCVPDLEFRHPGHPTAYLEVMGFWSREAVWRRVDLVQGGMKQRVLFAVSSRLRVSEEVLDDDLPSALLVYKGVIPAKRVLGWLDG